MLRNKFKHNTWFNNSDITVKQFLDYALEHSGDFIIETKTHANSDNLLENPSIEYYLSDRKYNFRLDYQERNYLALNNDYFKFKLPKANGNYMMAIIAKSGEPIDDDHDIVYLSR